MKAKMLLGTSLAVSALVLSAKDAIVMSVNGINVPRSEFEYLYKKNSQQQIEPQPLDKYVDMFSIYKMKVADAKSMGLDTTASFRKEMHQYAEELAAPFLIDSVYLNKMVDATLGRMQQEAEARHIMLFKRPEIRTSDLLQRADSIREALRKGADFADMAAKYSEDRGSNKTGGSMGYIVAGRLPYAFECAVFDTPEGKYSDVIETESGVHIIKGGKKIPARGSVQVAHILKLVPQDAPQAVQDSIKAQIDSISAVLAVSPDDFAGLARDLSDDKATAAQGGMLRPFMSGQMVPDFNEAAFALKDGETGQPVRTNYGWHIIRRMASHPVPDAETLRQSVTKAFTNPGTDRYDALENHIIAQLEKKLHAKKEKKVIDAMFSDVNTLGLDSALVEKYSAPGLASQTLFSVNKHPYTVADLLPSLTRFHYTPGAVAERRLESSINALYRRAINEQAIAQLEKEEPEFRNLINEYRDGSLLYELSVKRVWDKAAKDTEGLKNYFERHRKDFAWNEPHVKGYLVQAANDSVAEAIRLRLQQLTEPEYVKTIRTEFKDQASIDKILMTQGQNPMVDNLIFGSAAVTPPNNAYTTYFLFDQKVITEPEDVNDVKVMATNAYQNELENEWIDELKAKYPVTINEKELRKIK